MSTPFIAEIRMLPYTFSPADWYFCNGQILAISQNQALFSLIGSIYGGDARTTLGLPNLMGRAPLHVGGNSGTGPGVMPHFLGQRGGDAAVTLTISEMPSHDHTDVTTAFGTLADSTDTASNQTYLGPQFGPPVSVFKTPPVSTSLLTFNSDVVGNTGSSQPHENRQPFIVVPFCICSFGQYPSRN
ncbi:phage tail protein [Bowmanella denitrificans]|uniref:phage tail protein n=1 Tax=Bowmanella denitrificans TaxID=366582 RepID=UPI0031D2792C